MAENSSIEWTDATFNPWLGCTKVSQGCKFCYAETLMDKRYGRVEWGPQGKRIRTSVANWRKPLTWNRQAEQEERRYRVFCASLADVFEDKPDQPEMAEWRNDLFDLIHVTPYLDWLLLTKRPENVVRMMDDYDFNKTIFHLHNIWIGTSVEDQKTANERIPHLLRIPAAVHFLSCEPLIGSIDLSFSPYPFDVHSEPNADGIIKPLLGHRGISATYYSEVPPRRIDWVIIGGESGPGARPFNVEWARDIMDQCRAAGVAPFVKQLGARPYNTLWGDIPHYWRLKDKKGGDMNEWPGDLRVREFPAVRKAAANA